MHSILDRLVQIDYIVVNIPYTDFDEVEEIGSGGYGTVYTAKCKNNSGRNIPRTVVLKRFKNFNQTPELFISEVSIY